MLEYETVNPGADLNRKEAEELMEEMEARENFSQQASGASELDDAPSTLPRGTATAAMSNARMDGPMVNSHLSRPPPPMINESFARIANPRSNSSFLRPSHPVAPPAPIVEERVAYRQAQTSMDTMVEDGRSVVPLYSAKADNKV